MNSHSQAEGVCRVKTCPLYGSLMNSSACKVASMRQFSLGKELCEKAEMVNGGLLCIEDEKRMES